MARKKVVTTEIHEEALPETVAATAGLEDSPLPATSEDIQLENDVRSFIANVGSETAKVTVYSFDPLSQAPKYMGWTLPSMASEDWLQSTWGEGRYNLRLLDGEGRIIKTKTVYVGPPPKGSLPAPLVSLPESGKDHQTEMLREELKSNRELILKLIETMAANANSARSSVTELASVMEIIKGLQPAQQTPGAMISEIVNIFKSGVELGTSGGAPEKGFVDIAKDVLTSLPGVFAMLKPNLAKAPAPAAPVELPQPTNGTPVTVPDQMRESLRKGLQFLKTRVAQGHTVESWIEFIMMNLDQANFSIFTKYLDLPFEELVKIDPEIGEPLYRDWFAELFEGLKNEIRSNLRADGATRDGSDAPDNAGSDIAGGPGK